MSTKKSKTKYEIVVSIFGKAKRNKNKYKNF